MIAELLVPYGISPDGQLVKAEQASKNLQYHCPDCKSLLVFKAGESVVRHFAHKSSTVCAGESLLHQTAKMLIAQVINEQANSANKSLISLSSNCSCCKKSFTLALTAKAFSTGKMEQRVGSFVCDVLALRQEKPVLVVEVYATHAIENRKKLELSLPWIELDAEAVLINPYAWKPRASRLKVMNCRTCQTHLKRLGLVAKKWEPDFLEPARYQNPNRAQYLVELVKCWQCEEEVPVYWWSGVPFCKLEPPTPRPKSIQNRYSKRFKGQYWANTCSACGAIQGDNFLFIGVKGKAVFSGLPLELSAVSQAYKGSRTNSLINHMFRNF